MSIRKILVPVDGTDATALSLETAFLLGRDVEAHIEVLHVRADPRLAVPLVGEGMSGAMIEELIDLTEKETATRAVKAREMFDRAREASGVAVSETPSRTGPTANWMEDVGAEEEFVVQRGRLADLVVVARPTAQAETPSAATFNAAVFESGRPVLVAPLEAPRSLGRRIVISWNGSAEAARAVSAALPLIARAEAVSILSIAMDERAEEGADGLMEFLAWHGVSAERRAAPESDGPMGAAIIQACADADLLVMGAYTHSRLRQLILGGVTRHVLERATLPLLMAH